MKKILPEPSEYMDIILDEIRFNLTKDTTNVARELVRNVLGFNVSAFGDVKISPEKTNLIKNRISTDLLKKIEDDLVNKVEQNLEAAITKKYINQLISDVLARIYIDVENRIQQIISDKISGIVTERINETLTTWLVASKFVDAGKVDE